MLRPRGKEPVYLVTDAPRSRFADVDSRTRAYLLKMGLRTVLFVLAVFVFSGVLRWIAMAGAIALPWFSVIGANATPVRSAERPTHFIPDMYRGLRPPPPRDDLPPAE